MFSAPGHPDTLWSDVKGKVARSRQIAWEGGTAATHAIEKVSGRRGSPHALARASLLLEFRQGRGGRASGKAAPRHPQQAAICPHPSARDWRRVQDRRKVGVQIPRDGVRAALRSAVAELQHLHGVEIIEAWDYNHPLTWRLAEAIYEECESDARQGLLYTETASALLALHVARTLSNVAARVRVLRRGGLAPAVLNRACDYMVDRMAENVSLSEVAAIADLSLAHFSFAFKTSMGIAPHAWLRRQRVDRAKMLLLDPSLALGTVALSVGFSTQSALGAAFRRETGSTPAAWRRTRLS